MKLKEIWINNYKSITNWQKIHLETTPVVFVGKNGSGKSNLLEAIEEVIIQNSDTRFSRLESMGKFDYKLIFDLSKKDILDLNESVEYNSVDKTVEAYCTRGSYSFSVNRLKSKFVVDSIVNKEKTLRGNILYLNKKIDEINSFLLPLVSKNSMYNESFSISMKDFSNLTRGYLNAEYILEKHGKLLEELKIYLDKTLNSETDELSFDTNIPYSIRDLISEHFYFI